MPKPPSAVSSPAATGSRQFLTPVRCRQSAQFRPTVAGPPPDRAAQCECLTPAPNCESCDNPRRCSLSGPYCGLRMAANFCETWAGGRRALARFAEIRKLSQGSSSHGGPHGCSRFAGFAAFAGVAADKAPAPGAVKPDRRSSSRSALMPRRSSVPMPALYRPPSPPSWQPQAPTGRRLACPLSARKPGRR